MRPITFKITYESSLSLPLSFIDRYMPACTPVYALIYIYGLRHSQEGKRDTTTQEIGEVFHILETDVLNAWKYWETQGLIKMDTQNDGMSIEFLPFPEDADKKKEIVARPEEFLQPKSFNIALRPQYTVEELSFYQKQSEDIARLFAHGEQTLGKLLTYHDLNILFGFYDWLRLPIDVILYLLTYCSEGGHRDLRYVEKAAMDWAERSISSVDAAKDYTETFDRDFRAVMKGLGHPSAFPSPTQRKYMHKWLNEMEMPIELILEACDKTAVQIGKPKLTYIDKIIADWFKKGIRDLEGVEADEAEWIEDRKKSESTAKSTKRRNRFANFKGHERDYEQLEKMEVERLMKSVEA